MPTLILVDLASASSKIHQPLTALPPSPLPLSLDKIGITTAKLHYHLSHLLIKCQDITDHRAPPILPIETTKIDSHLHLIVPSAPRLDLHIIIPFLIKFATRSLPPPHVSLDFSPFNDSTRCPPTRTPKRKNSYRRQLPFYIFTLHYHSDRVYPVNDPLTDRSLINFFQRARIHETYSPPCKNRLALPSPRRDTRILDRTPSIDLSPSVVERKRGKDCRYIRAINHASAYN